MKPKSQSKQPRTKNIHHDIFNNHAVNSQEILIKNYTKTPERKNKNVTINDTTPEKFQKQRSLIKVDYPHQKTDIFHLQEKQIKQVVRNNDNYKTTFSKKSHSLHVTPQKSSRDHAKEYIMHCLPEEELATYNKKFVEKQPFYPKFAQDTVAQRRVRDFINGEITERQVLPSSKHILEEKQKQIEVQNPDKSLLISNIFFDQEKEQENVNYVRKASKSEIHQSYSKTNEKPWLQREQALTNCQVNENANFGKQYAKNMKQKSLIHSNASLADDQYTHVPQQSKKIKEPSPLKETNQDFSYHKKSKSQLLSAQVKWNKFDSRIFGQDVDFQKNLLAQPMSKGAGIKEEKRQSNDGLVNNNYYNSKKRCNTITKTQVCTFDMNGDFDSIKQLRELCRQYDCQLVDYKQSYDNIKHKPIANSQCTIRSSQTPEKNIDNLKGKLNEIGVELKQSQPSHILNNKESGIYLKQQKQLKELAELERQYQRQAKSFLQSNSNTNSKSFRQKQNPHIY